MRKRRGYVLVDKKDCKAITYYEKSDKETDQSVIIFTNKAKARRVMMSNERRKEIKIMELISLTLEDTPQ